ncbi:MAG: SRPBCC family protein [Pyrinomonadaceae bacterium]
MKPAEASLPSDTEVLVKRSFDAPAKLVWRAYMEPDLMRRWCGSTPGWSMPVCEMDMRVGGEYQWRWRNDENSMEFGFTGEVLEVVPHSKIVHTQLFDPGNMGISMGGEPSIITITFDEVDGITNVATTIKYASQSDRDAALETGMTDGMEMNYKRLDEVLSAEART